MFGARRRGTQRAAHPQIESRIPREQLVRQERNLGFSPHPHDANLHAFRRRMRVGREYLLECRVAKIVERGRVDHVDSRLRRCGKDERGACAIPDAVFAELTQVSALKGIVGIVPIANVYHCQPLPRVLVCPGHEARDWSVLWVPSQQTLSLCVTYVKRVGQGVVGTERTHEVVLQTLTD